MEEWNLSQWKIELNDDKEMQTQQTGHDGKSSILRYGDQNKYMHSELRSSLRIDKVLIGHLICGLNMGEAKDNISIQKYEVWHSWDSFEK